MNIVYLLNIKRIYKKLFIATIDIILSQLILLFSFFIFLGDYGLTKKESWFFIYSGNLDINQDFLIFFYIVLLFIPIFIFRGVYNSVFRYLGLRSFINLFYSSIIYGIVLIFTYYIIFYFSNYDYLKQLNIIFIIFYVLLFWIFLSLHHFLLRTVLRLLIKKKNLDNIIIYGAGSAGYLISQQLQSEYKIIGFIDDNKSKIGTRINNIYINTFEYYTKIIQSQIVDKIYIAIPSLKLDDRKNIIKKLLNYNIPFNFLNPINQSNTENFDNTNFQNITVNELIDRKINWDIKLVENKLKDKTILVTGAGGSIGSELAFLINTFSIKKLILLDHSEFNLYNLNSE